MRLDRLRHLEHYILQKGSTSLEDISTEFHISVSTARRDVIMLEKTGSIARVHGGAIAKEHRRSTENLQRYRQKNSEGKQQIGALASQYVQNNQTVFIGGGSTTKNILPHLIDKTGLTIITHSVYAIDEAINNPNLRLLVLGGEYSSTANSFHSFSSIEELKSLNIDIAFLGASGITIDNGYTVASFGESFLESCIIKQAKKTVIMADSSKFCFSSTSTFAKIEDAYAIVTDAPLPEAFENYCRSVGVEVVFPPVPTRDAIKR